MFLLYSIHLFPLETCFILSINRGIRLIPIIITSPITRYVNGTNKDLFILFYSRIDMVSALPLLAEFLGSFLLILSVLASGGNAFVIGGTLALVILLIGNMSGAHVNPAISLAMFIKGSLSLQEFFSFVVVQLVGATASLYAYNAFA